jgi:uncharacterized membrane protein YkoI
MHKEQKVSFDTLPAAAKATIQAQANGGTVTEVEKKTKKTRVIYEAEVKGPGTDRSKIEVTEDGKLLKYKACEGNEKHEEK